MEQEQTTINKPDYNDWMRSLRKKALQVKGEEKEETQWQNPP